MPKKKTKLTPWDIQDYLKTPKYIANYLESVLEENDAEYTIIAVKDAITALRNLALKDAMKDPTPPELMERRRILNEKLTKCTYYEKKCSFWGRVILIDLGMSLIVLWLTKWALLSVILFGLAYIPACIRLSQYGKAVNDL